MIERKKNEECITERRKKERYEGERKVGRKKAELPRVYCRYLYIEREKTGQKSRFHAVV
jgi:hypothetical protein